MAGTPHLIMITIIIQRFCLKKTQQPFINKSTASLSPLQGPTPHIEQEHKIKMATVPNIDNFLSQLDSGDYTEWREDIPQVGGRPSQTEYSDEDYLGKLGGLLNISNEDATGIVARWAEISKAVEDRKVTSETLASIISVAFNIISPKRVSSMTRVMELDQNIWPTGVSFTTVQDKVPIATGTSIADMSTLTINPEMQTQQADDREDTVHLAASYLCMSLIRLVVKPVPSYQRSLTSIKQTFGRFYGMQSSIVNQFNPPAVSLEQISNGWGTYSACSHTISYLLGQLDKKSRNESGDYGFLRFLIFQHVEMMGMQIYKMILNCMSNLPFMTPGQFLRSIETPESKQVLRDVMALARGLDSPGRVNATHWWKYSKMVDPTYFVNFSMSRNVNIGYTIACIMNTRGLVGVTDYSNPKNIKVFEGLKSNTALADKLEYRARLFNMLYSRREASSNDNVGIIMQMERGTPQQQQARKRAAPPPGPSSQQGPPAKVANQPQPTDMDATPTPPTVPQPTPTPVLNPAPLNSVRPGNPAEAAKALAALMDI